MKVPTLLYKPKMKNSIIIENSADFLIKSMSYPRSCFGNTDSMIDIGIVTVFVVTNALLVRNSALAEEEVNQFGGIHSGILIWIC